MTTRKKTTNSIFIELDKQQLEAKYASDNFHIGYKTCVEHQERQHSQSRGAAIR